MEEKPKLSTEPYKGVRDFYPEDMAVENYIFSVWRKAAEEFQYQEYGASPLEYAELYRSKGSDEIVNEQMYVFTDKGDREVALRPEMTPTLARMIAARRKGLKLPLRWFSIPNVFRYERPQRGRKREHFQLNCDIMGIAGIEAEVEIISLAHKIMIAFGAKPEDFEIRISSRKLIEGLAAIAGFGEDPEKIKRINRALDLVGKVPQEETEKELTELHIPISILSGEYFKSEAHNNMDTRIPDILSALEKIDIKNSKFDPKIARGFDYYTGMVFEVFDTNPENKRSLFGGGRYDNLLEMFGVEPLPTVGFGMGDVTIRDFLETHGLPLGKKD